jgi:hypothetical protein
VAVRPEGGKKKPGRSIYRPPVVGEGKKDPREWKRSKKLDDFAREVAAGKPNLKTFRQLGLSAAEKRLLGDLTRRYSQEVQADVGKHLVRGTANALASVATLPTTWQTADRTADVVRENAESLNDNPRLGGSSPSRSPREVRERLASGGDVRSGVFPGFGRLGGKAAAAAKAPAVAKAAAKTPEEKLIGSLGGAKKIRREQERLRSQERAKRGEAMEKALLTTPGAAGRDAALAALKGELPKLQFGALKAHKITAADVTRFEQHIRTHPEFLPYEKLNAERALTRVLDGVVPTKYDVKMLKKAFGEQKAADLERRATNWKRLSESLLNLVNVPRAMKSSYDVSGMFRQDLLWFTAHPRRAKRNVKPMFDALRHEGAYDDLMGQIYSRPNFGRYQTGRLALTDTENLATREEAFIGANYAEKFNPGIPGKPKAQIPIGRGVRASGRAYTGLLNQSRADWMDLIIEKAQRAGYDIDNEKFLSKSADFVNTATGRGSLGDHEAAVKSLNLLLFSPRLIASRLRLLADARLYVGTDWEGRIARQEARRAMASLLGLGGAVLTLAHQAGADVGLDPRSSDFGKIKIGDTRIDIWGGLQQYVVAAYRMISGEKVNSATNEVEDLERFGHTRIGGTLGDVVQNKLAPVPAYFNFWDKGRTFSGEPFKPGREAAKLFLPIGFESTYDTYSEYGAPRAAATFGINAVGVGTNTYGSSDDESPGGGRSRGRSGRSRSRGRSIYRR